MKPGAFAAVWRGCRGGGGLGKLPRTGIRFPDLMLVLESERALLLGRCLPGTGSCGCRSSWTAPDPEKAAAKVSGVDAHLWQASRSSAETTTHLGKVLSLLEKKDWSPLRSSGILMLKSGMWR